MDNQLISHKESKWLDSITNTQWFLFLKNLRHNDVDGEKNVYNTFTFSYPYVLKKISYIYLDYKPIIEEWLLGW